VEYKGEGISTTDDTKEKERLGNLWADRSRGTGLFLMVKGPGELSRIAEDAKSSIKALPGELLDLGV